MKILMFLSFLLISSTLCAQRDQTFYSEYQEISGIETYDNYTIRIDKGIVIKKNNKKFLNFTILKDKGNDELELISGLGLYELRIFPKTPSKINNGFEYNSIIQLFKSSDKEEFYNFYIFKRKDG